MIKKISALLFLLVGLFALLVFFYFQSLKPQYSGASNLSGLSGEVTVHFDSFGIPHIYAETEEDAYRSLGYVHAQDRLWQMEVVRRIAPGKLSEIFGSKLLKPDMLFRSIGINEYSKKAQAEFEMNGEPKIKAAAQAYLDGINSYIEQGSTPIEFTILGLEKTKFTMLDVYNTMGYMSFSFAAAHKTEPIVTNILNTYGLDFINDLDVSINTSGTLMKSYSKTNSIDQLAIQLDDIMSNLPASPFIGSNSWVIGPDKTESGKVILANDPHIGYSQPSVWYEAHIETPDFSFYGYHLAGYPFAIIGHNREYATGLTMFENDDIDLFFEENDPNDQSQYKHKEEWKKYAFRNETIKVKDTTDVNFTVSTSVHGPVMNEALELENDMAPVSMYWTYTKKEAKILETSYYFSHLKGLKHARDISKSLHAPGLNIMYGDADGNFARWSSAHLIQRPDNTNSKIILEGASGKNDPIGFYNFSYNPKSENAPWGYCYSANNQTESTNGVAYPGYYVPNDRGRRITRQLDSEKKWDVASTKKMMVDVGSDNATEIAASIVNAIDTKLLNSENEEQAIKLLQAWDGTYLLDDVASTIYNKMVYKIQESLFRERLGKKGFKAYLKTHLMKRSIQPLFANDSSVWWDNPSSEKIELRRDVITSAWVAGIQELEVQLGKDITVWKWDKVHTLEHKHVLGTIAALRSYFNVGPFPVPGSNEVINNYLFIWNAEGKYEVHAGPSTRRIVDFADVERNSWSILPTGNSGNVFSPYYDDQAEMYVKGEYRKQLMNKDDIIEESKGGLILKP